MAGVADDVPGFTVPVHRALSEPILLGGAPRAIAIMNGTLAGALGLGLRLWLIGIVVWAIGHFAAVWAAKRDPLFVDVGLEELLSAMGRAGVEVTLTVLTPSSASRWTRFNASRSANSPCAGSNVQSTSTAVAPI